ncbi:MAG: hypothetical protein ACK53Y_05665, partial [bacterium]
NGLNPSPRMQFKAQHEDPINSSDVCYQVFGKNAEKCPTSILRHSSHAGSDVAHPIKKNTPKQGR